MTDARIKEAETLLREYKQGKTALETRVKENYEWWQRRNWGTPDDKTVNAEPQKSAWLVNSILNKHADAIDNFPQPNVLPREEGDKQTAQILSGVLPAVLEQNKFDKVWSDAWWNKLQMGASVYGVFWNQRKLNGLGDVEIRTIDLLNIFWEPGVNDVQNSRNVFHVESHPTDTLKRTYKQLENMTGGQGFRLEQVENEDNVHAQDTKKSLVVDWYYKVNEKGKDILHFCKFCNGILLYSSEDDPATAAEGFYKHGMYPFVFDVLFPIKESPAGFGYIDLMKDAQERIDLLGASITKNARMRAAKRFFLGGDSEINEKEFTDWTKDIVHVTGSINTDKLQEIKVEPLGADVMGVYQGMVDELKETSGNRDFSQGGTTAGVTAASAIAALQEAGSKLSRDMLKHGYMAFASVCELALEVIRQFYDLPRTFRIVGQQGLQEFVTFDNASIMPEIDAPFGEATMSVPVFDISVKPQKNNPYSKVAQNEMAMEFYRMGFFNPQIADQALIAMDMMDFDGKAELTAKIQQNAMLPKLLQIIMQVVPIIAQVNPMLFAQVAMILQQAGQSLALPQAQGNTNLPTTNALGETQKADDILSRKREEAAGRSDPNGGAR